MRINTYIQFIVKRLSLSLVLIYTACQDSVQIEKSEPKQTNPFFNGSLNSLDYHQAPVSALTVMSSYYILGHNNGALSIWKKPLNLGQKAHLSFLAHEQTIRTLMPTSVRTFRSLSADGSWAEWSLEGRILKRGRIKDSSPNVMLNQNQSSLIFFGDAKGTVTAMKAKKRLWRTAGEHGRAVFGLAWYNDKQLLSVGSDGSARCWWIKDGQSCGYRVLHQGWITKLSKFNGDWLTAGSDGLLKLWPKDLFNSARVLDSTLKAKTQLAAHSKNITQITSYDDLILSGDDSGNLALSQWNSEQSSLQRVWLLKTPIKAPIQALAIDPKHRQILLGGGQKKQLYIYSLDKVPSYTNSTHGRAIMKPKFIVTF